ncbi:MAG: hypothetical protein QOD77_1254 [Thermoplasmata archaeon]|jgi:hypothetical protein|nr:hypothetical protein [Thermoplasmata archaeon]
MNASAVLCLALCALLSAPGFVPVGALPVQLPGRLAPSSGALLLPAVADSPLAFEANLGQWDAAALYRAHASGYEVFLAPAMFAMVLRAPAPAPAPASAPASGATLPALQGYAIFQRFEGADPEARVTAEAPTGFVTNYFVGDDPARWATDVPHFRRVTYHDLYPGIDLVAYGTPDGDLEYDFVVQPGADPSVIRMRFEGALDVRLGADGSLAAVTPLGEVRKSPPVAYQEDGADGRVPVASAYRLDALGTAFDMGAYDRSKPLVIDPYVAYYSTYLGGSGWDYGEDVVGDASGNAFVVSTTSSTNFPTTAGAYDTVANGGSDVAVTKMNPAGGSLGFSTYLGGGDVDEGAAIALDGSGNLHITGVTESIDYPQVGWFNDPYMYTREAFYAKLGPAGNSLLFSARLGNSGQHEGSDIQVDGSGNAYVVGHTTGGTFPTTAGAYRTTAVGGYDAFALKFTSAGALAYSTYLGGAGSDFAYGVALDGSGNVYITGYTDSANFPVTAGVVQGSQASTWYEAFVTKLNAAGNGLVYSTYLGGTDSDTGTAIALDGSNNAYVTGYTGSNNFPITAGAYRTEPGWDDYGYDVFVTKLNPTASAIVYSTYFASDGSQDDAAYAIDVDASGNAYVAGYGWLMPVSANAFDWGGGYCYYEHECKDSFFALFNAAGSALAYSTHMAGDYVDSAQGIDVVNGMVFVAGYANNVGYPTIAGAYQASPPALGNGVLTAFTDDLTPPSAPTVSSSTHPVQTAYGGASVTMSWSATDNTAVKGYSYDLVTSTFPPLDDVQDSSTAGKAYSGVATGTYIFRVKAVDKAGNWGPASSYTVNVDGTAPALTAVLSPTHPDSAAWSTATTATFVWNATDNHSGIDGFSLDLVTSATPPALDSTKDVEETILTKTYTGLASGTHTFRIKPRDNVGLWGSVVNYAVKVDVTAPSQPTVSSPTHAAGVFSPATTFTVNWGATDAHSGIDGYSYDLVTGTSPPALDTVMDVEETTTTDTFASLGPFAEYTFRVRAVDNLGNWGPVRTFTFGVDTVAPVITSRSPTPGTTTAAVYAPVVVGYADEDLGLDPSPSKTVVNPASVQFLVDGRDVRADWAGFCAPAQPNVPCSFTLTSSGVAWQPLLPWLPGQHTVHISLTDTAGNTLVSQWGWTQVAALPSPLPSSLPVVPGPGSLT